MENLSLNIAELQLLRENNILEFHQQLRGILKGAFHQNINYMARLIEDFYADIMKNGIFFIDVLNENFLYFLKQEKIISPLKSNLFLLLIDKLTPICDKQSLFLLKFFFKKISKKDSITRSQTKDYIQNITDNLLSIEHKMKGQNLHPYRDIIIRWF